MSEFGRRAFERVLVIMFENEYRSYVMNNTYMRNLAAQGTEMLNYFGVMHPSQTNYIASIAGELCNVTDDDQPTPLDQRTIVDLIEESPDGLRWKAYMDSYIPQNTPWTPDLVPKNEYPYVIKHNPFSSFSRIIRSESRWQQIQNEASFWQDIVNGTLPEYAWFTPNMWNDGHYLDGTQKSPEERAPALVDQLATWLESFFGALKFPGPHSHLPPGTLVVVTFDEADFEKDYQPENYAYKYTYDGPNQIYTVLLGDMIPPGSVAEEGYNHYSLLKTIEKNFGLGSLLKNDLGANWFQFLWGKTFAWQAPQKAPFQTAGVLTTAPMGHSLMTVVSDSRGALSMYGYNGSFWSDPQEVGVLADAAQLAHVNHGLVLVYQNETGLSFTSYDLDHGWAATQTVVEGTIQSFALTGYANGQQVMLAWSDETGKLYSKVLAAGSWADTVALPASYVTEGPISLAVLGASLFLIFQVEGSEYLDVVSYNTAPFNRIVVPPSKYAGVYDNTTQDKWSPSAFPVAHFGRGPYQATPGEAEPLTRPYASGGPLATATLDGVIHLAHAGPENPQIQEETFSISGLLTPELPISYNAGKPKSTSNGYGTLAQAGWTPRRIIDGVVNRGAMSMSVYREGLGLLYQSSTTGEIKLVKGGYQTRDNHE